MRAGDCQKLCCWTAKNEAETTLEKQSRDYGGPRMCAKELRLDSGDPLEPNKVVEGP